MTTPPTIRAVTKDGLALGIVAIVAKLAEEFLWKDCTVDCDGDMVCEVTCGQRGTLLILLYMYIYM